MSDLKDASSAMQSLLLPAAILDALKKRARLKHSEIQHAKNMRKSSKHAKTKKPEFLGFRAGLEGNVCLGLLATEQ